ncbi:YncE family protein [Rufibacter roseus]|uniref:DUF5074 domain-containing protein n=1 Tax=Rufibacter roseus TaxID=1567108 RepID=A0ABW2DK22_9BACT|nr:YncE family protein [Rufibacter roseus]
MKTTRFNRYLLYTLASGSLLFTSCSSDDDSGPKGAYEHGVFITNEGSFGTPNGEVSYYDPNTKTLVPELFKEVNDRPLGDVVQSMTIANDKAYLVANNSNKVEVVNAYTFEELGVIEDLLLPRYMVALNSQKGYITEWVDYGVNGRVAVVDLNSNTVLKTIEVGQLPEQLVLVNNKLYVANSSGNTLSVINTATDQVESTIDVGDNPNQLVVDASNNIWVLRGGYGTSGALIKINPANQNQTVFALPGSTQAPGLLAINGARNQVYYSFNKSVYRVSTTATTLPTAPLFNRTELYGLGVSPQEDLIYAGVGPYASNGRVVRFKTSGERIDSFQVRILPNGFTFR